MQTTEIGDIAARRNGKQPGVKSFSAGEDLAVTKAYQKATSDPAIGTDQDTDEYYGNMKQEFDRIIGDAKVQDRNVAAIKTRWTNAIQKALLKFSACMNRAVSEYHSGWSLEDYMMLAKQYYQTDVKKPFIHDLCWMVVKQMPKFCLNPEGMSKEMKRALELDDPEDTDELIAQTVENTPGRDAKHTPASSKSHQSLKMAPRPLIGKKAAKRLKYDDKTTDASRAKDLLYQRIAENGDRRIQLQQEKLTLSIFAKNPQSPEAQEFFKLKQEEALLDARLRLQEKKKRLGLLGDNENDTQQHTT